MLFISIAQFGLTRTGNCVFSFAKVMACATGSILDTSKLQKSAASVNS